VRLKDYERIAIIPHGMLHYVPFPALLDENGGFLISRTALSIVPSASIWLALLQRGGPARQFVGVGNPLLGKGAAELPYSGQELEAIAKEVVSAAPKVIEGADATNERLVSEAPTANILHLATHGLFPDDKAMDDHAVLLSVAKGDGGTLTASRVRKMNLRSTRLTVLSVCNGGLYRIGPADSPFGLIPAFIEAGSQNVMGTLWPLDDKFGRDFMIEYYSHLLQDGPAKAYQKTAMRFIGGDEYIRNWAGFVLVGTGRPFDAAQN
jgi:CHAT domain-containing protein